MLALSRWWSHAAHGSRYERRVREFRANGRPLQRRCDSAGGVLRGLATGHSLRSHWEPVWVTIYCGDDGVVCLCGHPTPDAPPAATLRLTYASRFAEEGASKHGHPKFAVHGFDRNGKPEVWRLKAEKAADRDEWLDALRDAARARWEENAGRCSRCRARLWLSRCVHTSHPPRARAPRRGAPRRTGARRG